MSVVEKIENLLPITESEFNSVPTFISEEKDCTFGKVCIMVRGTPLEKATLHTVLASGGLIVNE